MRLSSVIIDVKLGEWNSGTPQTMTLDLYQSHLENVWIILDIEEEWGVPEVFDRRVRRWVSRMRTMLSKFTISTERASKFNFRSPSASCLIRNVFWVERMSDMDFRISSIEDPVNGDDVCLI